MINRRRSLGKTPPDKRIICTYNVLDDSVDTQIICPSFNISTVKKIEIDGINQSVISRTYPLSAGEHVIKIGLTNSKTVGSYLFQEITTITSAIIPDNFTTLERCTFNKCTNLQSLVLPKNITTLPSNICSYCSSLLEIDIPEGVTSMSACFNECSSLATINIPSTLKSIGNYCFRTCSNLKTVNIIDLDKYLDLSLTANNSSPTYNGANLYLNGNLVTSITTNKTIKQYAFQNCKSIQTLIVQSGPTSIGQYAFSGCTGIQSITLTESIKNIGGYAFNGCSGIQTLTLPEGLTTLNASCFRNCTNLASVDIPSTLTTSLNDVFNGDTKLKTVNITNLDNYVNLATSYNTDASCPTVNGADIYLNGVKLTEVTLNKAPARAFRGCTSLQKVNWDGNITSIGSNIFYGCIGLTDVSIPSTVTTIGSGAFRSCNHITSIVIPEGVTVLNTHTFHSCSSLASITIPSTITEMNDNCFYGVKSPGAVYITDMDAWCRISFKSAQGATNPLGRAQHLYLNGTEVTSVIVPNNVTILRMNFEYLRSLTSVTLPEGLTTIDLCSFYNCTGLTHITIPSTVTTIGQSAFQYCNHITSIELPSGVTSIGVVAFANMPAMTKFICNATVPPTLSNTNAFASTNNAIIYVPDDSVNAYKGAANWSTYASRIKGLSELPE